MKTDEPIPKTFDSGDNARFGLPTGCNIAVLDRAGEEHESDMRDMIALFNRDEQDAGR